MTAFDSTLDVVAIIAVVVGAVAVVVGATVVVDATVVEVVEVEVGAGDKSIRRMTTPVPPAAPAFATAPPE